MFYKVIQKNKKVDVFGTLEPFEFDGYAFNMLEQ